MSRSILMSAALVAASVLTLPVVAEAKTSTVEVTRFHLLPPSAPPITGASVAIEPMPAPTGEPAAPQDSSLQFGALAGQVSSALARAGFRPLATPQGADYVARIALTGSSELVQRRPPISIGIGGGTGGWNGGFGGGVSFPIGGGTRTVTSALLTMQIRRVADGSVVWEGRATTIAPAADPLSAAPALAEALLKGFPGPSGQSVKVKVKSTP